MTNLFKRYHDTITGEIVEYPEDAAALFPHLKLVPSERAKQDADDSKVVTVSPDTIEVALDKKDVK